MKNIRAMSARSIFCIFLAAWFTFDLVGQAIDLRPASSVWFSVAWADDNGDDGDDSGSSGSAGSSGSSSGSTGSAQSNSGSDSSNANTTRTPARLPNFLNFLTGGGDAERSEVLASGLTSAQHAQLAKLNYRVVVQRSSSLIGPQIIRVKVPDGVSLNSAMAQIKQIAPKALVDRNHFYYANQAPQHATQSLVGWGNTPSCNQRATIGMIDTAVDRQHASLTGQAIELQSIRSADRSASDAAHGTAVASLLVGRSDGPVAGLLPRARLLAVDAFHQGPRADSRMDAFDFAAALDWLVKRGVKVVNLSFSGPANALIESSIQAAQKRGVVLVASVGNDGPTASPRYPAAYAGVIAVTAVRSDLQVFRRAVRGEHLSLSAPGVDVNVADTASLSATVQRSGTSYAAPFVTAAAALLQANGVGRRGATAVHQQLIKTSLDLGPAGFDPMFGHGLLQMGQVCQLPKPAGLQQAKAG
jgi:subtilisin family serine protease